MTLQLKVMSGLSFLATLLILFRVISNNAATDRQNYSMYVWTHGFDHTVAGCDVTKFRRWDTHSACFTHVWNTPEKRKWLWDTCNVPGREISSIYLSDVHRNLQYAKEHADCQTADIMRVRQTLQEGHKEVLRLKIYGLYAVSDLDVSEKDLVQYIVYYNDHCAQTENERFDGVAVNNEAYAKIKCGSMNTRLQYLNNLKSITTAAKRQRNGTLLTHYSVSWHWGRCDGKPSLMTWNNKTADVSHHVIDIFDSIDVQVGYIIFPAISERMILAGYQYAQQIGKPIYTTLYTDKTSPCQVTFFPDDTCRVQGHSEQSMFGIFDDFDTNGIGYARPCIHYFRGIYSSGVYPGWPSHGQGTNVIVG